MKLIHLSEDHFYSKEDMFWSLEKNAPTHRMPF